MRDWIVGARLEDGLLQNGYVLFGDNAYLNSFFMATPYSNVSGNPNKKSEDNYNFFHSQLRIRVECAFGMLVARWGILGMAISNKITVTSTIVLMNTLARLHNFCLEELISNELEIDTENIINWEEGYGALEDSNVHSIPMPTTLMDVGHHFKEVPRISRHNRRVNISTGGEEDMPRFLLHDVVLNLHSRRPNIRI
jgi:hypothetical protein